MEDKRNAVRASKFIPVMIEDSKVNMLFRANIDDPSYDGIRVIAGQFLPKGTQYAFSLKFTPALVIKGEVRWIAGTGPDTFRIGIHFLEPSPPRALAASFGDDPQNRRSRVAQTLRAPNRDLGDRAP